MAFQFIADAFIVFGLLLAVLSGIFWVQEKVKAKKEKTK